jgi:hypothetical protein
VWGQHQAASVARPMAVRRMKPLGLILEQTRDLLDVTRRGLPRAARRRSSCARTRHSPLHHRPPAPHSHPAPALPPRRTRSGGQELYQDDPGLLVHLGVAAAPDSPAADAQRDGCPGRHPTARIRSAQITVSVGGVHGHGRTVRHPGAALPHTMAKSAKDIIPQPGLGVGGKPPQEGQRKHDVQCAAGLARSTLCSTPPPQSAQWPSPPRTRRSSGSSCTRWEKGRRPPGMGKSAVRCHGRRPARVRSSCTSST